MTARKVLVTGGAGYIGSNACLALLDAGHKVVVLDNLSTGFADAVPDGATLIRGDLADQNLIVEVMTGHGIEAVMHFAASVVVPESVADPYKYYRNNVGNTLNLAQAVVRAGVGSFVFSSTAAVYRSVSDDPVDEGAEKAPASPYGWSKLISEQILTDMSAAHGFTLGVFRYFNVAGADPAMRSGQRTKDATHLIKVACEHAAGRRPALVVFGNDYNTPDGTGVRDYIHVSDLVAAHVLGLEHMTATGEAFTLNCGYGRGASVLDVARTIEKVSGREVRLEFADRRPGDAAVVVADADRLRSKLGWKPRFADLEEIVGSAWRWETRNTR